SNTFYRKPTKRNLVSSNTPSDSSTHLIRNLLLHLHLLPPPHSHPTVLHYSPQLQQDLQLLDQTKSIPSIPCVVQNLSPLNTSSLYHSFVCLLGTGSPSHAIRTYSTTSFEIVYAVDPDNLDSTTYHVKVVWIESSPNYQPNLDHSQLKLVITLLPRPHKVFQLGVYKSNDCPPLPTILTHDSLVDGRSLYPPPPPRLPRPLQNPLPPTPPLAPVSPDPTSSNTSPTPTPPSPTPHSNSPTTSPTTPPGSNSNPPPPPSNAPPPTTSPPPSNPNSTSTPSTKHNSPSSPNPTPSPPSPNPPSPPNPP
ncbi:rho GTPase-activating protein gacQ-like, partial [Schistocerca gregaria]|uniref:rho GTPase-activating protein gacQ-like n=1 Tax=Schistocerca gregaria TaxID=7010 RepID=UPI00211E8FEC